MIYEDAKDLDFIANNSEFYLRILLNVWTNATDGLIQKGRF